MKTDDQEKANVHFMLSAIFLHGIISSTEGDPPWSVKRQRAKNAAEWADALLEEVKLPKGIT